MEGEARRIRGTKDTLYTKYDISEGTRDGKNHKPNDLNSMTSKSSKITPKIKIRKQIFDKIF